MVQALQKIVIAPLRARTLREPIKEELRSKKVRSVMIRGTYFRFSKVVKKSVELDSCHDFHQAPARGSSSRRNHLQRPDMDASPCQSRWNVPYGRGRDRSGFDRTDRFPGYHPGAGTRIRFPWRPRSPEDRETR